MPRSKLRFFYCRAAKSTLRNFLFIIRNIGEFSGGNVVLLWQNLKQLLDVGQNKNCLRTGREKVAAAQNATKSSSLLLANLAK